MNGDIPASVDESKAVKRDNDATSYQRMSEWIHCFCVITFDLEMGQSMEVRYKWCIQNMSTSFFNQDGQFAAEHSHDFRLFVLIVPC